MNQLFYVVFVLYVVVLSLLFVYGLNFFYLSYLARRHRAPDPPPPPLKAFPPVTVQLPIFNEMYVARRLIDAVCRLDWPRECLHIQVLDDSTDATVQLVAKAVRYHQVRGVDIVHLHRTEREGYKAGALAAGLAQTDSDLIALFDADFVPPPDFLQKTVPYFQDEKLGFIQTRWGHLNDKFSLFAFLQSLAIDGHFVIEQYGRQRAGYFMNFNGTAGVWRRQAIEEAGGWRSDTLTEDLDLSYRAQLAGWRAGYLRDVVSPAELPVTVNAYRRQQYRWARGSFECVLRLTPRLWRAPLPLRMKLQALLHLTGYGIHLLMSTLAFLYPLVLIYSQDRAYLVSLFGIATLFNLSAVAPTTYFLMAQRELHRRWWWRLPAVLFLSVLGAGMMFNNLRAILHAFFPRSAIFERTPKFGIIGRDQTWRAKGYHIRISPLILLEGAMLVFNLNTLRMALHYGNGAIAFYSALFATGLAFLLGLTLYQALERRLATLNSAQRPAQTVEEWTGAPGDL